MQESTGRRRFRWLLRGFVGVAGLTIVAGFVVGRWTKVTTIQIPARVSSPVRMAVLADFHIGANGSGVEQVQQMVRLAQQQHPDVILLLGDYVSTHKGVVEIERAFEGIDAPQGVYAVLGNHDHWSGAQRVVESLQRAGIRVLNNESVCLKHNETTLTLVGIDDMWSGKPDFERALANVPDDGAVILLSHNPDAVLMPASKRAILTLSGHTHAGQVWTPYFIRQLLTSTIDRNLIPATEYGQRNPYGLHDLGDRWVYITSGVTRGRFPPRWFTRPEIVIVEIVPEGKH